jgi:Ca2+-binding EF-hand superfamily protein
MADTEISAEEFDNAFVLMDHRGCGRLELETVYQFVDTLDQPPAHSLVKKVYDEFDEDGSGDIDSDEFLGLCRALQKLTKVSVRMMMMMYTKRQYTRLFDLVYVEDKSNPGADRATRTISKKEMKVFLDSSAGMLSITSADLGKYLRDVPDDELNIDSFSELIGKLIKGKSISQVVHAFEEAKRIRLEARKKAYQTFEGSSGPVRRGTIIVHEAAAVKPKGETPAPQETTDMNVFAEAFALMDSRGGGALSLDNVYEFCEALPDPPQQSTVRKIYNQFDADGSGDIDSDEFLGFCQALEKAVGVSVQDMLRHFTNAMYKRLFELVDEGGDSNARVSKEELKMLLEAISPLLSSKYNANDVLNLIRDYPGELDFQNFCDVVKKLTVGKSISQVVTAFEEAKRRRKAAKHYAMQRFEGEGRKSGLVVERGGDNKGGALCFMCCEKDEQIRELQDIIAQLEAGKGDVPRAHTLATIRKDPEEESRGDPWAELHSLNRVVATSSWLRKFPEYVKPAVYHNNSSRILEMANFYQERQRGSSIDTDAVVRTVNDAVPEHEDNVSQLRAVADVCMMEIREFHRHADELLATLQKQELNREHVQSALDHMAIFRDRCASMRNDADWLLDSLTRRRAECCTKTLTVAPYTNRSQRLVQDVLDAEAATQQLLDMVTVMCLHGSDQLLDIEICAKRMLSGTKSALAPDEVSAFAESTKEMLRRLSPDDWNKLFMALSKTMSALAKDASTSHSTRKEKAMMTLPVTDLSPLQRMGKFSDPVAGSLVTTPASPGYEPNVRIRSSSPRVRTTKQHQPRDAVAHIDRIVQDYIVKKATDAPPLPQNFQRVEAGSNMFYFGTKKIEVIPADKHAVVKVGGGYLMFDEFCRKYAQQEARRFEVRECVATPRFSTSSQAATPLPGRSAMNTPRLGGSGTPGTPRTLVRKSGGGFSLV